MLLFSFIIPVYNVENYIERCINSIYKQFLDLNIFEIIIVNDGSTDNSEKVIKKYANDYKNIKAINKLNGGVSSARNIGIQNSEGKYIIFVDADDTIIDNSIEKLIPFLIDNKDLDMLVACSYINKTNIEKYNWKYKFEEYNKYNTQYLLKKGYERGSVCGVVFKRKFLIENNIIFPLNVQNGEDTIFFSLCLSFMQRLTFINIPLYNIYEREGSASRSLYTKEKLCNNIKGIEYLDDIIKKNSFNSVQKDILQLCKYRIISNIIYHSNSANIKYNDFCKIANLKRFLPIKLVNTYRYKVMLLNWSSSLFYFYSKLKHYIK